MRETDYISDIKKKYQCDDSLAKKILESMRLNDIDIVKELSNERE